MDVGSGVTVTIDDVVAGDGARDGSGAGVGDGSPARFGVAEEMGLGDGVHVMVGNGDVNSAAI